MNKRVSNRAQACASYVKTSALALMALVSGCEVIVWVGPDVGPLADAGASPQADAGSSNQLDGGDLDTDNGASMQDAGKSDSGLGVCPVPPRGRCVGGVLQWCDENTRLQTRDCSVEGRRCELDSDRYACVPPPVVDAGRPPIDAGSPLPDSGPLSADAGGGSRCATEIEREVMTLVNFSRAEFDLEPLRCDPLMTIAARKHSADMCDNDYFSHTSLDGRSPFERMRDEGVEFGSAGENIALGQTTASFVHSSWMGSSGHRANILSGRYERIGVGYVACDGRPYWTQNFAD